MSREIFNLRFYILIPDRQIPHFVSIAEIPPFLHIRSLS